MRIFCIVTDTSIDSCYACRSDAEARKAELKTKLAETKVIIRAVDLFGLDTDIMENRLIARDIDGR